MKNILLLAIPLALALVGLFAPHDMLKPAEDLSRQQITETLVGCLNRYSRTLSSDREHRNKAIMSGISLKMYTSMEANKACANEGRATGNSNQGLSPGKDAGK